MNNIKKKLKEEVGNLYEEAVNLLKDEFLEKSKTTTEKKTTKTKTSQSKEKKQSLPFDMGYQQWYSKCLPVIRQLLPERYLEFQEQYKLEKRKEIDFLTYTISDYLIGLSVKRYGEEVLNPRTAASVKFQHQMTILYSAFDRIDSILSDIEGVLQAQLFTDELESAEDLLKKGHLRAAGALTGVTLEAHLGKVCDAHLITFRKKSPTIADYNDALKNAGVIDTPMWRRIQTLADIRNICAHKKDREPTKTEVQDLIAGVRIVTGNVF